MNKIEIDGKVLNIVTLDFETFYSKEYTLRGKLNMSEFVRDSRFKCHGVGIRRGKKGRWYTGKNIKLALEEIDWENTALLCHNTPFDGFILSHHYGIVPAFYLDTLAMARVVHGHDKSLTLGDLSRLHGRPGKPRAAALEDTKGKCTLATEQSRALGEYCLDDCEETQNLFEDMYGHVPDPELLLIHYTTRMFADPILLIDIPLVQKELEKTIGAKTAALLVTGLDADSIRGNISFARLLNQAGVEVPTKNSPTTGLPVPALAKTDPGFQDLLNSPNPKIANLCKARLALKSTIGETRALRFLEAGKNGMPLPVMLLYAGAHTLRWSGGNKMNLQNLVRGGALRQSILAPDGYGLAVSDSSQIEARMLAWLAGQINIVAAFAAGKDVYKLMAASIYRKKVSEVTPQERFIGKVCVLALGFGMGAGRLQATLKQGALGGAPVDMDLEESENIVRLYRRENHAISTFWRTMESSLHAMATGQGLEIGPLVIGKEFIRLPNNLFLHYPGLRYEGSGYTYKTRHGRTKIYGGLLTENIVQALARCVIAEQWLATEARGHRVVLSTHDELVVCRPLKTIEKDTQTLIKTMSTSPAWAPDLPLAAEGGWARNYSK